MHLIFPSLGIYLFHVLCMGGSSGVPGQTNLTEELAQRYTPNRPNSRLNILLNRFCNFVQLKSTPAAMRAATRQMIFKFGEASTRFPILAHNSRTIENQIHAAALNLTNAGFHLKFFSDHRLEKNRTWVSSQFIEALLLEVKKLVPSEYFPPASSNERL